METETNKKKDVEGGVGFFIICLCVFLILGIFAVYRTFNRPTDAEITYMGGQRVVVLKGHRNFDGSGPATYLYYMAGVSDPVLSITDPIPDEQRKCNVWFIIDLEGKTYKTTSFTWRRLN